MSGRDVVTRKAGGGEANEGGAEVGVSLSVVSLASFRLVLVVVGRVERDERD